VPHLLLVDDASALAELFADAIRARLGYEVTVVVALADVGDALEAVPGIDLALVDLSFPQERGSGLDALVEVHRSCPSVRLAIITQGDEWVARILRDAWDLLPIATVVSKSAPLTYQLEAIKRVVTVGSAPVDPAIQPLLPARKSPYRTKESFRSLVQHGGHAKLWRALLATDDPTYKELADVSGLKLNTVKNYRAQLVPDLELHGLRDPSLKEMGEFAQRCQSFLVPYLEQSGSR
jgi:DNA-binding NarL/FixJ family response regulator